MNSVEQRDTELLDCFWRPIVDIEWSAYRSIECERSARAFWTDELGIHLGPAADLPEAVPVYCTHLWTWSADSLTRVRIEGTHIVGAELSVEPTGAGGFSSVTCRLEKGVGVRSFTGAGASAVVNPPAHDRFREDETFEVWTALPRGSAGVGFMRRSASPSS